MMLPVLMLFPGAYKLPNCGSRNIYIVFIRLRHEQCSANPCIMMKVVAGKIYILLIFVDHLLSHHIKGNRALLMWTLNFNECDPLNLPTLLPTLFNLE